MSHSHHPAQGIRSLSSKDSYRNLTSPQRVSQWVSCPTRPQPQHLTSKVGSQLVHNPRWPHRQPCGSLESSGVLYLLFSPQPSHQNLLWGRHEQNRDLRGSTRHDRRGGAGEADDTGSRYCVAGASGKGRAVSTGR